MAPVGSFTVGLFAKDSVFMQNIERYKPGFYIFDVNETEVLVVSKKEYMPDYCPSGVYFIHMPADDTYQHGVRESMPTEELELHNKIWDEYVATLVEEWKEVNGTLQTMD